MANIESKLPTLAQLRAYYQDRLDRGVIKDIPCSRSIMGQLADFSHQTPQYKGGILYFMNAFGQLDSAEIVFEF